jgi:hypothetical protein
MRFGREHGITRRGVADLVNASWAVPQNPVIPGLTGLGDFSSDVSQVGSDLMSGNFSQALGVDTISGLPTWVWLTGGIILYMFFFGGGDYSRAKRAGRAARKAKRAAVAEYSA